MKIKSVVKVMNFHALLRVDKARKKAEKYRDLETQLTLMMSAILNNKNFILDKKISMPSEKKPALIFYIGSDLGFCGSINSSVLKKIKTNDAKKVIIGKKVNRRDDDALLSFNRDEYDENRNEIIEILKDAVLNLNYSSITLVYNHYYNVSHIEMVEKQIYPLELDFAKNQTASNDYVIESEDGRLLEQMIVQYLEYEIRIAWLNSFASENVLRQSSTQDSLKKIDEIEEEEVKVERKIKKNKSFKKVLDSYINQKGIGGN